ncbi:Coronafacic acid synthetase, ligase component [Pseudomonas cannabina pv. alisalensis]|uniref:Coronafacic acid synthetase, ligase component n=3 Tax=Pseudomonas syringae group TaxID=136849 RepID=A0A3M3QL07_PSECA|nr:class I adenylate-forming enzyme family protein [Pseudomonas cannabina]KPW22281.1 Coronafacic acid synthetase, ligase component [Pseudomonas cannabina pv. alisalensis]MBM0141921.1 acyl--CoA ligase [Pseudomonas cannabina pv. alisalensis]RMN80132.1 Coronafacic acid synthetase, ligase component [Pseudomonas cannabina pv. alisalensis]RMN84867.1 Coronafacic acid synthetase, ligase component [Pseudomonas cannabina]RMN93314.1 Coronafacic acid synthetase, ligase component [Pseudomonas cannabina]
MSLISEFRSVVAQQPDTTAVVEDQRAVSFTELAQLADKVSAGLLQAGLQPGDRVAIHLGNRLELVALYYACLEIGAVTVPINRRLVTGEIEHLLHHSGARYYIGDQETYSRYAAVIAGSATVERAWIVAGEEALKEEQYLPWSDLLVSSPSKRPPSHADSLAAIFYTSGTTGLTKGIVHSQATLAQAVDLMKAMMPPRTAQGALDTGAVHSMMDAIVPWSILMILAAHRLGRAVVLLPVLTAETTLALLQRLPLSFLKGAPSHFNNLLAAGEASAATPLPSLTSTYSVSGGDPCPPKLGRRWHNLWGGTLRGSYGTTESGPIFCQPDVAATEQSSIGWPLPGVALQQTENGELLIRSPANTPGLWNGQDADRLPAARWIATGDLVQRQDDGGYLIIGREKDMLKCDAYSISPVEVEQELLKLPDIAEAVVFGVPDATIGERPVALLRTNSGRELPTQQLKQHLKALIAEYKHPRQYLFVERIPLSSAGKVSRKQLASDYREILGAAPST